MIVIKVLIAIVGVLIAGGGLTAAWFATGSNREITSIEAEVVKLRSENARARGGEEEDRKIQERGNEEIKNKELERNIRYGVAGAGLLVGLSLALLPFVTWKRKASAAGLVAPEKDAPGI
jgi:hypothetical protein